MSLSESSQGSTLFSGLLMRSEVEITLRHYSFLVFIRRLEHLVPSATKMIVLNWFELVSLFNFLWYNNSLVSFILTRIKDTKQLLYSKRH